MPKDWRVYLLECRDGSFYCGVTTDIVRRLREHETGRGGKYTRSRLPVQLIAQSEHLPDRSTALRAEAHVKKQPAKDKALAVLFSSVRIE